MEKTILERASIVRLHKIGYNNSEILKELNINRNSREKVKRTINRYNETGSLENRKHKNHKRLKRSHSMIKCVRERIRRNPCRKQKIMALEMGVSLRTMNRTINEDLKLKALNKQYCHFLSNSNKLNRLQRCRALIKRHDKTSIENILFTDEKIFTIEQKINKSNDKVYGKSQILVDKRFKKVTRSHHPSQIMVWAGVSIKGKTPLHFVEPGVKMDAKYYQEEVLMKVVKPLNNSLFEGQHWTFQQDSAPSHKANTTQKWLEKNVPDFINRDQWPSASPDLNPLDYSLWSKLELKVCSKRHKSLDSLKKALLAEWEKLSIDEIRASIENWVPRLKACRKEKGDHFEF